MDDPSLPTYGCCTLLGVLGGSSLSLGSVLGGTLGLGSSLGLGLGLALGLELGGASGLGGLGLVGSLETGSSGCTELVGEALDATAGVDELLGAGVERVALVAQVDDDLALGGVRLPGGFRPGRGSYPSARAAGCPPQTVKLW